MADGVAHLRIILVVLDDDQRLVVSPYRLGDALEAGVVGGARCWLERRHGGVLQARPPLRGKFGGALRVDEAEAGSASDARRAGTSARARQASQASQRQRCTPCIPVCSRSACGSTRSSGSSHRRGRWQRVPGALACSRAAFTRPFRLVSLSVASEADDTARTDSRHGGSLCLI